MNIEDYNNNKDKYRRESTKRRLKQLEDDLLKGFLTVEEYEEESLSLLNHEYPDQLHIVDRLPSVEDYTPTLIGDLDADVDCIDYITIGSTGNSANFGDLSTYVDATTIDCRDYIDIEGELEHLR